MKRRYEVGLEKLQFASSQVNGRIDMLWLLFITVVIDLRETSYKNYQMKSELHLNIKHGTTRAWIF